MLCFQLWIVSNIILVFHYSAGVDIIEFHAGLLGTHVATADLKPHCEKKPISKSLINNEECFKAAR